MPLETFHSHVNIVYVYDGVVYNTDEILFSKSLLFCCVVSPFLFHLHSDAVYHSSQQLCRIVILLDLLIAYVQQNINALDCNYCILLFEIGPRNVNMYPFDMAELQRKRQS